MREGAGEAGSCETQETKDGRTKNGRSLADSAASVPTCPEAGRRSLRMRSLRLAATSFVAAYFLLSQRLDDVSL